MDDVRFRGNVVWTAKSALKIGTEVSQHVLSNVVFEDNDVIHADRGKTKIDSQGRPDSRHGSRKKRLIRLSPGSPSLTRIDSSIRSSATLFWTPLLTRT